MCAHLVDDKMSTPAPAPVFAAAAPVIPSDSPFAATAKAPSTVPAAPDGGAAFNFSFALTPPPVEAPTLVPVVPVVAAAAELASSDGKTEPPQRKMRRPRRRKGGTEAEVEAEAEAEEEWEGGEEEEWEGGEEDEGAAEEQAEEPAPSKQIDLAQSFDLSGFAAALPLTGAAKGDGKTSTS